MESHTNSRFFAMAWGPNAVLTAAPSSFSDAIYATPYRLAYYPCGHFCEQPNLYMCCLCEGQKVRSEPMLCRLHAHLMAIGAIPWMFAELRYRDRVPANAGWPDGTL